MLFLLFAAPFVIASLILCSAVFLRNVRG